MTELLLRTRVLPCCPDEARLQRPRLLAMLRAQPHARLVVVNAPGGYGKSTFVYDALRDTDEPFGWYNVQSEDRDPRSFASYVLEAIHRAFPDAVPRSHDLLQSPEPTPPRRLLTLALNEIVDRGAAVRLVLDDVHLVVSDPAVNDLLRLLITSAPESLRLYVTSREPLDLPLARLQAQGVALLIGAEHLLFSEAEVEHLFREVWEQPLPPATLSVLAERSAGWITALVLLRHALQQRTATEATTLLASFDQNRDALFAYLGEEVLQRQPPETVRFLLETSLLEQLDAQSVAAATGDEGAGDTLNRLERAGLFLIRLEGQDRAFRYHHLFGQFLLRTLRETAGEDDLRARHARLARWYEERDPMAALARELAERASRAAEHGGMRFWSMKAAVFLASIEVPGWEDHLATALRLTREGGFLGFWRSDFWTVGDALRERAIAMGMEPDLLAAMGRAADVSMAAAPHLEIRTLGGLQVLRDGRVVAPGTWSRRRVVQLLALFLSSPGLTVTTDRAVEALWSDAASPERARQNVRVHIGHLRDALQPGRTQRDPSPITSLKDGYRLEVGFPVVVDWLRFQELVGQGDSLARADRHQAALDAYLEAHELYGGDFLPEEAYSDWTARLRGELRTLHGHCLAEIGDVLTLQGSHAEALPWYRRHAETDPSAELLWHKVLECCRTLGDRAGALRAYQTLREALHRDLDLEPSEETEALLAWIDPR